MNANEQLLKNTASLHLMFATSRRAHTMTDYSLRIRCNKEQVATVMVTTACIVADAQIDPSYSPGGASCILIGSSVFAGFTVIIEKSGPSHSFFAHRLTVYTIYGFW